MMTFSQHYRWTTPHVIDFVGQVEFGVFGAVAASTIQGLLVVHELLKICNERRVNGAIVTLLAAIAKQHGRRRIVSPYSASASCA
jgi:hypothetical protein